MKKVLIVDDAAFIRMMIRDALQADFEIVGEARSAEEALELWEGHRPDVTTMDISLTGEMSGIDALRSIKNMDAGAVVVMVSSMGEEQYIKRSIDLGAAEFIVKPFTREDLNETLKSALGMD